MDGCESEFLAITVRIVTGINEASPERIKIYPVPAPDVLRLSSTEIVNSIEIFNTMEQSVKRINHNENNGSIHIGELAKGLYIIKLSTSSDLITRRIIKE